MAQSVLFAAQQATAAKVVHYEELVLVGQLCQGCDRCGLRKTCDAEIARVNGEQQRRSLGECRCVVGEARAICRPYFYKMAAALSHNIRYAEASANLHQLTT